MIMKMTVRKLMIMRIMMIIITKVRESDGFCWTVLQTDRTCSVILKWNKIKKKQALVHYNYTVVLAELKLLFILKLIYFPATMNR